MQQVVMSILFINERCHATGSHVYILYERCSATRSHVSIIYK
jgi:hypothetical protein